MIQLTAVIDYHDGMREPTWIHNITDWEVRGSVLVLDGPGFTQLIPMNETIRSVTFTTEED